MPCTTKDKPVILRKLGPMERFQAASASVDNNSNTLVACHYTIPSELVDPNIHQDKLVQTVETAVAKVVLAHPLLQVGTHKITSRKPAFIQLDTIDLSKHIEWRLFGPGPDQVLERPYEALRKKIYTDLLCRKYPSLETQPGWGITILRRTSGPMMNEMEVIFGFHHAYMDGMSAKIFHEDLVKALNSEPEPNRDLPVVIQNHTFKPNVTASTITPPQENLVKFKNTLPHALSTIFLELAPHMLVKSLSASTRAREKKCKAWPPITPLSPMRKKTMCFITSPVKTHFTSFTIEKPVLDRILAACRAHKTTFTGLLQVCILVSLVGQVDASQTGSVMQCWTIVEARRHVKPSDSLKDPSRVIGNMVSKMGHNFGGAATEGEKQELLEKLRNLQQATTAPSSSLESGTELSKIMWALAARVRSEIQAKIDLGIKNDPVGLMNFIPDAKGYFRHLARNPRQCTWVVTNLGTMDGGDGGSMSPIDHDYEYTEEKKAKKGKWSIRKAHFTASAEVTGAALVISSITVRGGDLSVHFTWEVGLVEDELWEEVVRGIERFLRKMGDE